MSSRQLPHARLTWIGWFAHQIDDPVTRLKYLRAVTPVAFPQRKKWGKTILRLALAVVLLVAVLGTLFLSRAVARVKPVPTTGYRVPFQEPPGTPVPKVWLVDKTADSETYSNGLRLDTRFTSGNHARGYLTFPLAGPGSAVGVRRHQPVGIVFHTTESRQAPFEAGENGALKRIGESLVEYVARRHAYHFLIDRFGRVYRIVMESDAANHAGYSVWSDGDWLYLNLNESFLGVSFEAQTVAGQEVASVSSAQIRAAAMLTEMLRDRYSIAARNCVTHAQVSVNPANMRVGYHTDWASSFPFALLGLPDNYARALPALASCGFEYDATFLHWAGTRLYAGVELAEEQLDRAAAQSGTTRAALRKIDRMRYRGYLDQVRHASPTGGGEEDPPDIHP